MSMLQIKKFIENEEAMLRFGAELAEIAPKAFVIYFYGELGAGKTTLVRGFLRALGYQGAVKSPTYTLVESYYLQGRQIYHFDLYRLAYSEELDFIGMRDYLHESICLVEWADRGKDYLPNPDIHCYIEIQNSARVVVFKPETDRGQDVLERLNNKR